MARIICSVVFVFLAMVAPAGTADRLEPEEWLREAEAAYDRVATYTAVFHKQQRIAGKLYPGETILLKFRKDPFSLYMKWIRAPHKGSELLYAEGWNENRVRAHRGGILRFIVRNFKPKDPALMKNNLRPVTSTGIGYLLEAVAENMRTAIGLGELTFSGGGEETVYGRTTRILKVVFPKEKAQDYAGHRYIINQDVENKAPIRIRIYDQDNKLIENYGYENLELNKRLTDDDFNPENPEYQL